MKLFNGTKNETYIYWAAVGLILDSKKRKSEDQAEIIRVNYELAKKLILKVSGSGNNPDLKNPGAVFLLIHLNKLMQNFEEALRLVGNESNECFTEKEALYSKLDILLEKKDYRTILDCCSAQILSKESPEFFLWKFLVACAGDMSEEDSHLIQGLLQSYEKKTDRRSFELARIEVSLNFKHSNTNELAEMMMNYGLALGEKPSCFSDLIYLIGKANLNVVKALGQLIHQILEKVFNHELLSSIYLDYFILGVQ